MDDEATMQKAIAFSDEEIASTVTKLYDIQDIELSSIKEFSGYEGRIYYFRGTPSLLSGGQRDSLNDPRSAVGFVLKVAKMFPLDPPGLYEEMAMCMRLLRQKGINCPKPVELRSGQLTSVVSSSEYRAGGQPDRENENYTLVLLEFVEGTVMSSCSSPKPDIYFRAGKLLGQLNREAMSFAASLKAIPQRHWEMWDLRSFDFIEKHVEACDFKPETKKLIQESFDEFRTTVQPIIPRLTSTYRHGDFNDYNILVCAESKEDPSVYELGVIDFNDSMMGPCVFDLGSSLYYMILLKKDPVQVAVETVRGYLSELDLPKSELQLLPLVIKYRAIQSLVNGRVSSLLNPENAEYLGCHAKYAEDLLQQLPLLPLDKLQL